MFLSVLKDKESNFKSEISIESVKPLLPFFLCLYSPAPYVSYLLFPEQLTASVTK